MSVISSKHVKEIIFKTLAIVNEKIIKHGEIVGYILYKMLQYENCYTDSQLMDYTLLGVLHDIGLYKESNIKDVTEFEVKNLLTHPIYGFLFLKYLSPMEDKAEIVLYHHLDYDRYGMIQSQYFHIIECLNLADQMDTFLHMKTEEMEEDYLSKYRDIKFSGAALDLFLKAEAKYKIMDHIKQEIHSEELTELFSSEAFTEQYRKKFLEMIVYTIDFRSESTVIHSMATVSFSQKIGRLMGLVEKDLRNIYYGALLHDLGKLAIPLDILEAPGKLTDEQMRVMKAHVRITEMILEDTIDREIVEIAIRHHEKIDGTGYHKGLTEEELTLPQKIVAVGDILSALYEERSYKDSYDSEMIKKILNEDADNGKISRTVVDCVLKNYDQIIANFEEEKETTLGLYLQIKEQYLEISKMFM